MKKFLFRWVVTLLVMTTALSAQSKLITEGMTKIECKLKPLPPRKKTTAHKKESESTTVPHVQIRESTSANWSGYVAVTNLTNPASGAVEEVSAFWTVPSLSSVVGATGTLYSSIWVGIDGYANGSNTVEQIGTEQDWDTTTSTQTTYAWYELFPAPPVQLVGFNVTADDLIAAEVAYVNGDTFYMVIANFNNNTYVEIVGDSPGAERNSAEWIVEAPTVDGSIANLANFDEVFFENCAAKFYETTGSISNQNWTYDPLTMENMNTSTVKAMPSSLQNDGYNFSVTWEHE